MQINEQSSLNDWLNYLAILNQDKIELGLERVLIVANKLNLCNFNCKVVTVSGTNGKGTCIETARYFLNKLAFNVGVYTSPHIFDFRERVKINQEYISEQDCCACFYTIYQNSSGQKLTYFEFTTLMALYYFKLQDKVAKLDFILLEVGLGGRLDAVNVVQNDLAIITSIGLDHCEYLGNTKQQIAIEKAHIIKNNNYVICGEQEIIEPFISMAAEKNAKLKLIGRDYSYNISNLPEVNFPRQNIATAIAALNILVPNFNNIKINIAQDITNLKLIGRFMQINKYNKSYIVDCAHNVDAAKWLANKCKGANSPIYIVFGCCKDKDYIGMMREFLDFTNGWYLVEFANNRSNSAEVLLSGLNSLYAKYVDIPRPKNLVTCNSVKSALQQIEKDMADSSSNINIIVFGSFYVIEEALRNI